MMVQDPITGEWVDDGIPESNPITGTPRVDPAMPSPVDASNGGGPLGTDANPMVATIARQPKPPIEIVQSGQKVTPSKAENEATARLGVANSLVQQATNNETGVLQEEAQKVTIPLADQKLAALQKEQAKLKELDERDEREAAEVKAHAKALAEDKAKKQIAAGRARADYFKGNFVGNIVAALVQSVAAGLHARAGKDGLSPAERIFEQAYQTHEKALLAEFESSKDAQTMFEKDRARWEAEKAARRVKAAQDAVHDVNIAIAVSDRAMAGMAPDKIAAAQQQKQALQMKSDAQYDQKVTEGLRSINKYEKTLRPGEGGAAAGGRLTEAQANLAGSLQDMAEAMKNFEGVKISESSLKKIQDQGDELTAAQVKPGDSAFKPLQNKVLRGLGLSARNKFEGVPDKEQIAYQQRERAIDQLNKIITGAASTDSEVARRYQQWIIQPGDSDAVIKDKTNAFRQFVNNRAPLTGPAAPLVQSKISPPPAEAKPPSKPQPTGQDAAAIEWLKKNPTGEKADKIRKSLQAKGLL
jgi:hypothetical protein